MDRASKKAAIRRFHQLRESVADAVRADDPLRLIELGAPVDEYELEVGTIMPRLANAWSSDEVRRILHEEFTDWFQEAGTEAAFDVLAQDIWNILDEWRTSQS